MNGWVVLAGYSSSEDWEVVGWLLLLLVWLSVFAWLVLSDFGCLVSGILDSMSQFLMVCLS